MHKLLDYLSSHHFKVNSISGAKKAVTYRLRNEPQRLIHTLSVVNMMKKVLEKQDLTTEIKNKCIQAAYLHDIGYSTDFSFANFHPYDGYVYTKENGWSNDVCQAVLHHTFAQTLVESIRSDLINEYKKTEPTANARKMIELVTIADMLTLPDGNPTTVRGRINDIQNRYGNEHALTQHIKQHESESDELLTKWNVTNAL